MSALLEQPITILSTIRLHPAWLGHVSGLKAEKMLRGRNLPYLYVLRDGEFPGEYYVTFLHADLTVRHQPFVITVDIQGWYYENAGGGGPYTDETIDHVLHLIMHCQKGQNTPFLNFQKG